MVRYKVLKKRIEKDKAKKHERQKARHEMYDDIRRVATPRHYIKSIRLCRVGVKFKVSVQKYRARPFWMVRADRNDMLKGKTPKIDIGKQQAIRERGKVRIITPIKIRDRVNQRVLCDWALAPMIFPRLIYDNGASMKNKGINFTRKRFNTMLEIAKSKWGSDFYALIFDFRKFFDSIPRDLCRQELEKTFNDVHIVNVTMGYITGYKAGDVGVCLGSHVSQIMALCVPNFLDHWIKDVMQIQHYIRYMDDGVILHNDPVFLQDLARQIDALCEQHGLHLSKTKTHIVRVTKGICFLKVRYRIVGRKTVKRLSRSSVVRMRRKLKKFKGKVEEGKMTMEMVDASLQSWSGHTKSVMAFRARKNMMALFRNLFEVGD